MKYFKDIARANGIEVKDYIIGGNGVGSIHGVKISRSDDKKLASILKNDAILRVTYVGEVWEDGELLYTRR